jgi:hypothetical protein
MPTTMTASGLADAFMGGAHEVVRHATSAAPARGAPQTDIQRYVEHDGPGRYLAGPGQAQQRLTMRLPDAADVGRVRWALCR